MYASSSSDNHQMSTQCVSRKVPHKCIPYTPGKGIDPQDVNMRLTRLEQIVEVALPQYANGPFAMDSGMSLDRPMSSSPDAEGMGAVNAILDKGSDNKWSAESTPGPSGSAPILHQVCATVTGARSSYRSCSCRRAICQAPWKTARQVTSFEA